MAKTGKGFRGALGGFAREFVKAIGERLMSWHHAGSLLAKLGVKLPPGLADAEVREYERVESKAEKITDVGPNELVPLSLHQRVSAAEPIPSNYAYRAHIYGRSQEKGSKGQYRSTDYFISYPARPTRAEVEQLIRENFGSDGEYPYFSEIFKVTISEAYILEGTPGWQEAKAERGL